MRDIRGTIRGGREDMHCPGQRPSSGLVVVHPMGGAIPRATAHCGRRRRKKKDDARRGDASRTPARARKTGGAHAEGEAEKGEKPMTLSLMAKNSDLGSNNFRAEGHDKRQVSNFFRFFNLQKEYKSSKRFSFSQVLGK